MTKLFHIVHNVTRRPLSTGIFSARNVTLQPGFEPKTWCLAGTRTINCAMALFYLLDYYIVTSKTVM